MKKDIRNSLALKVLSYILIPILVVIIVVNSVIAVLSINEPEFSNTQYFYETTTFSDLYHRDINILKDSIIDNLYYTNNSSEYENAEGEKIRYNGYSPSGLDYIIVNKQKNIIYTNLNVTESTDTLEELKISILGSNKPYWNFNNKVDTNILNLKQENLSYSNDLYNWTKNQNNYEVYTVLNDVSGQYQEMQITYNIAKLLLKTPYVFSIIISVILVIALIIYLLASLGYKKGYNGIYLNWLDKIPLEIVATILMLILMFVFSIYSNFYYWSGTLEFIMVLTVLGMFAYILLAIGGTTVVKRLKAHNFWKSTIVYILFNAINNIIKDMFSNTKLTSKTILLYGGFLGVIFICAIGTISSHSTFWFLFFFFGSIAFVIYVFIKLLNYIKKLYKVKDAIYNIYKGDNKITLDPNELKGELKETAMHVNDIAGGLSNAIEESIKSERFKTELITNVSHDIKTPLTSIINYVDLLKQEDIDNDKVKEYIEILDVKSQRLKKLTEDLVEASKASSGNVKLSMEKINVIELINQATGEFEDKFSDKNLDVIVKRDNDEIHIMADNRYIYRVIENIFSNVSKYALENSRIYIDILNINNNVVISVKNISRESLNISADELMQRFVRGDRSRTTDGSGLGLSISKSLTEIQGGIFNIQVDGDLFKVEMVFGCVN